MLSKVDETPFRGQLQFQRKKSIVTVENYLHFMNKKYNSLEIILNFQITLHHERRNS